MFQFNEAANASGAKALRIDKTTGKIRDSGSVEKALSKIRSAGAN